MGAPRKKTNPGGDCRGSCHCLVDDDQEIPPMEQRHPDHRIVYYSLQTLAWLSSRGAVPSETDDQREVDKL